MTNPRQCGGCTFCCSIAFGSKPHGQLCEHAMPGRGCGIYHKRPRFCRDFGCAWAMGIGNVRPDELGAMFAAPATCEIHVFYTANPNGKLIEEELRRACNNMLHLYGRDTMKVHFIDLRPGGSEHARIWKYRRTND